MNRRHCKPERNWNWSRCYRPILNICRFVLPTPKVAEDDQAGFPSSVGTVMNTFEVVLPALTTSISAVPGTRFAGAEFHAGTVTTLDQSSASPCELVSLILN